MLFPDSDSYAGWEQMYTLIRSSRFVDYVYLLQLPTAHLLECTSKVGKVWLTYIIYSVRRVARLFAKRNNVGP